MKRKIRVGILFGGKSAEHEVSLRSAQNVIAALDRKKYIPVPLKISRRGHWQMKPETFFSQVDVVFPVLHGTFGEDGTVQGLLKLAGIPFVGADVLGSAVGMDKDVMKRLLRDAGIPIVRFLTLRRGEVVTYAKVVQLLGKTVFVKPANLGSSIGVSKAKDRVTFERATTEAFRYDTKILIEECIVGREVECAVLGNHELTASVPGEIVPTGEFYSYEAKYLDPNGARLVIPAELNRQIERRIQTLAIHTFQVLECAGLARVDFFLTKTGKLYVNEINTLPGFTRTSMYPKLFEASGIGYGELADRLIVLALERFAEMKRLETRHL